MIFINNKTSPMMMTYIMLGAILLLALQQIETALIQMTPTSLTAKSIKPIRHERASRSYSNEQEDVERIANMSSRVKETDWPVREQLDAEESVSLESSMLAPPSQQQQHYQHQLQLQQQHQQQNHLSTPIMSPLVAANSVVASRQDQHYLIPVQTMQPMQTMQTMQIMQPMRPMQSVQQTLASVGQQSTATNQINVPQQQQLQLQQQQQQQPRQQPTISENVDDEEQREVNDGQINEADLPDSFESNQADNDNESILFNRLPALNTDQATATSAIGPANTSSASASATTGNSTNISNTVVQSSDTQELSSQPNDLQVAAGHHSMKKSHDSKYYMFAESKKKGEYDSGYKMGGHKMTISGHSSVHKGHASGHVTWSGKKGKGMHIWEYMHKDKKGKSNHH